MSNPTIRPILWKHKKKKNGDCPIMLCITIGQKRTYFRTGFSVKEDQWDEEKGVIINYPTSHKRHENNTNVANFNLLDQIAKKQLTISTLGIQDRPITARALKDDGATTKEFRAFAEEIRNVNKEKKEKKDAGTKKEIARVEAFSKKQLMLSDIDATFLRKYEAHERNRGMSQNTINVSFKFLRRIIRAALAEKLIKENPFQYFKVPGYKQTDRVYLVEEEKQALIKLLKEGVLDIYLQSTLTWFLFGCYTGLRQGDWKHYTPDMVYTDEHGTRVLKIRAKKNGNLVTIPIGPTLEWILERLKDCRPPISGQKLNGNLKTIAGIAKIKKSVTSHSARHSFATMCATNKLPHGVTANLLGVDYRTVNVYYHITGQAMNDQAAALKFI